MLKGYEYQSEFARKYVAQGRTEALLSFLSARQLPVTDEVRARILACRDWGLLDTWIVRAVTAKSIADVLGESAG